MSIRNLFFDAVRNDGPLNALGIDTDTTFPAQAPDQVDARRFLVLRWGQTQAGMGPVRQIDLSLWAYDRDPNYASIDLILVRVRVVLPILILSSVPGGGSVVGVGWSGSSEDLLDPAYGAVVRNETYRITASGI